MPNKPLKPTSESPLKGSKTRKPPRTNGKAQAAAKPDLSLFSLRNPSVEDIPQQEWSDGFLILTRKAKGFRPIRRYLRSVADVQWEAADQVLRQGCILGIVANPMEAISAAVDAAEQIALPLEFAYDEDASVLFIAFRCEEPVAV